VARDRLAIDALGPRGEYRTRRREAITDTQRNTVVDLSLVPRLFVARSIAAQRKTRPLPTSDGTPH